MRFLHEWRIVLVVGIICFVVGVVVGRMAASGSHPHDVSLNTQTYHTCMYLYRDEADCAEVMKRLADTHREVK
jgi:uncharacterized membrane protein AbrB (regulator of aidB expression)